MKAADVYHDLNVPRFSCERKGCDHGSRRYRFSYITRNYASIMLMAHLSLYFSLWKIYFRLRVENFDDRLCRSGFRGIIARSSAAHSRACSMQCWRLCFIVVLVLPACAHGRGTFARQLLDSELAAADTDKERVFNKTIAAQFNTLLQKEFEDEETAVHGTATGAGRSFSNTVRSEGGTLETVIRLHRPRGGEVATEPSDDATRDLKDDASHKVVESVSTQRNEATVGETKTHIQAEKALEQLSMEGAEDSQQANRRETTLLTQLVGVKRDIDRAFGANKENSEDVDRLVDAADNEFVISNPKRGTMELQQDLRLINDLVIMLCSAAAGGSLFALLQQPLITGYLVAGSLVGPGGFGMIVELVQVETFAQFGIIFLLFGLGLEFDITKLRQVQSVAVYGGFLQMLLSMLVCGVVSDFAGASAKEGIFVGAFLSVSSTAVVGKCLIERDNLRTLCGQITMGTLILQDCTIGLLFALIPVLASSQGSTLWSFAGVVVKMIIFVLVFTLLSGIITKRIFRFVAAHSDESYQLTGVAFCLIVACASERLGLSMELGAFVAGVAVSATPYADQTLHSLEPFRNIFTALFLTSIGLIMNPYFLWLHLDVLVMSVFAVIIFKTTLIAVVVRAFGYNLYTSFTVGVSLAQVGELSFVLLSRASGANLVERKLYLLLLGTTALSLIFTPTLFRATPSLLRFAAVARFISKDELSEELSSSSK